jgi:hypothetical protein
MLDGSIDRRRFLECATAFGVVASLGGSIFPAAAQSSSNTQAPDSRLPDGTEFILWEQPLKFTKTYYVDNQHAKADDKGPGTQSRPFRTISQAAQVLQPGERVVIASGTYRECVRPARGGTSPAQMISYEAAPGAKVLIKGSEVLKDGWVQETIPVGFPGSAQGAPGDGVTAWRYEFKSSMFPDTYNPFALPSLMGEWVWLDTSHLPLDRPQDFAHRKIAVRPPEKYSPILSRYSEPQSNPQNAVTAEVAGSTPVVPAITPKDLRNDSAPENNKSKSRESLLNQFGGSSLL